MNYAGACIGSQKQMDHFSLVIDTTILRKSVQLLKMWSNLSNIISNVWSMLFYVYVVIVYHWMCSMCVGWVNCSPFVHRCCKPHRQLCITCWRMKKRDLCLNAGIQASSSVIKTDAKKAKGTQLLPIDLSTPDCWIEAFLTHCRGKKIPNTTAARQNRYGRGIHHMDEWVSNEAPNQQANHCD